MAALTLQQLVSFVEDIPPLSASTIQVMHMAEDPACSVKAISAAISSDVALTSRVLKLANSAYYGMPRSVSTVREAVLILGTRTVRDLSIAASAMDTLQMDSSGYGLPMGALWRHSVTVAVASQVAADRVRGVRPEEAFVAGLLHDIGKVVLHVYVAAQFQAILALIDLDGMQFCEAEKFVLGFDHAEVGTKIAENWNLPAPLCEAIGCHHNVSLAKDAKALSAVVHIANIAAMGADIDQSAGALGVRLDPLALEITGLTEEDMEWLGKETAEHLGSKLELFEAA